MEEPRLEFQTSPFRELDPATLYEILKLRIEVFAVEQNCVYQDLDDHDQAATHLLGRRGSGGELVAYARWFVDAAGLHLGRIVTRKDARAKGFGKRLVREALSRIRTRPILIDAQNYLERFYAEFGFARQGDDFILDGILHLKMSLE